MPKVAEVEARPLGDLLSEDEISRARLIKIDVEGGEPAVLHGLLRCLDRMPRKVEISVELSPLWWQDRSATAADVLRPWIERGITYVKDKVWRDNLDTLLPKYLSAGDILIDLAWNIDCNEILQWCHDRGVLYINTSVELWDPYEGAENKSPQERTLYWRHMNIRRMVAKWKEPGPTAVVLGGVVQVGGGHLDLVATGVGHQPGHGRQVTLEVRLAGALAHVAGVHGPGVGSGPFDQRFGHGSTSSASGPGTTAA